MWNSKVTKLASCLCWRIARIPSSQVRIHVAVLWDLLTVTGSADKGIRVFDTRGKLITAFNGRDLVRALVKLSEDHPSGGQFASAHNDAVIRIWTLKGDLVSELYGHEGFIYSLAALPSGEIVSSGEDRTARIWQNSECIQTITHPALSVWAVAVNPVSGDIITGASDNTARIFSRDPSRTADSAVISAFEEAVQSSNIPQEQVGEIKKTDLPGPEFLYQKSGTKEGQIQMIKESDGSITAHSWSVASQKWDKVGTVVESASGSGQKKEYQGKMYDYVFDVDIEEGKPPLKLPFNASQNPYEAATKFLNDNELPMSYLEETANFIIQNARGATLGESAPSEPPSYASTSQPTSTSKRLPQKDYLSISAGKPEGALNQIKKLNEQYTSSNDPAALTQSDLKALNQVTSQLSKHSFESAKRNPASSSLTESIPLALKIATTWTPPSNRLAGLDLLRFIAAGASLDSQPARPEMIHQILSSGIFTPELLKSNPKLAMLAIRLFTNLLYGSSRGRSLIDTTFDSVSSAVQTAADSTRPDPALSVPVTTFYLNAAVYLTSPAAKSTLSTTSDRALSLMEPLVGIVSATSEAVPVGLTGAAIQQATEPTFRALVALGTLVVGLKESEEVQMAASSIYDVAAVIKQVESRLGTEERFRPIIKEIREALSPKV